jgi:hypothetical protein
VILLPELVPPAVVVPSLPGDIFPEVRADSPDESPAEPFDSPRRVAARAAIEALQTAAETDGTLAVPDITVASQFSERHELFGVHMATRTTSAPKGSVVVGAVHKYPTLNVLLKGKVLMVSEHGKRMLVAPCMYMQAANTKKAGWVLEDCELTNVILMPDTYKDPAEAEAAVRAFHTVPNYNDVTACASPVVPKRIEG